jgi:hypothetical protein
MKRHVHFLFAALVVASAACSGASDKTPLDGSADGARTDSAISDADGAGLEDSLPADLPPPLPGLRVHLPLDEAQGATQFVDVSGYNNPGSCSGGACPRAGVQGKAARGVELDGVDDQIAVSGKPALQPKDQISVSAYVKVGSLGKNGGEVVSVGDSFVLRVLPDGNLQTFFFDGQDYQIVKTSNIDLRDRRFHHILGQKTPTALEIYLDGKQVASRQLQGQIAYTLGPNIVLGRNGQGPTGWELGGVLDQVRIFDRALSAQEIATLVLPPRCNDGALDPGEECDKADLDGASCQSVGAFSGGTLGCDPKTCTYDTSKCTGSGCPPIGPDKGGASAITTFHSMGLYWSPAGGSATKDVQVRYRKQGSCSWREGLPMKYQPIAGTSADLDADYRGSIVNLTPGTTYEVELTLAGTQEKSVLTKSSWSETFPVGSTVKVASQSGSYSITQSGTPSAYRLYDGTGAVIDANNGADQTLTIDASYVIVRGFTLKNATKWGIRITGGTDIIIEGCEITNWGDTGGSYGFGNNYQGAVYSTEKSIERIIVQRCKMHHPRTDANSWSEQWTSTNPSMHPKGAQCIALANSRGNNVFRYNECWSDATHMFNDAFGYGGNSDDYGFPGPDSDIYGNYVANAWDDCLEIEGGGRNVRVWNNYVEDCFIPYANAAVTIGPLYFFRNVSGRSDSSPTSNGYGYWLKAGYAGSETHMKGYTYLLHNTVLQPNGEGAGGFGTTSSNRILKHVISRNNLLHVRSGTTYCLSENSKNSNVDGDYDLCTAQYPSYYGSHTIVGAPIYATGPTFDFGSKTGSYQLSAQSPGYQAGEVLPNFSDGFSGKAPDVGAHQSGWSPLVYGVKATFVPPIP